MYNRSTGYGCLRVNDHETICTCPDHQLSKINQPCRQFHLMFSLCHFFFHIGICNRAGICGPKNAKCSEISTTFKPNENGPHFACFCSPNSFFIGKKCPDDTSVSTNATTAPARTTTESSKLTNSTNFSSTSTTTKPGNSTCPKCNNGSSSSHLSITTMFIILFIFFQFANK